MMIECRIRLPASVGVTVMTLLSASGLQAPAADRAAGGEVFRAGAMAVDVTPTQLPVFVNGSFEEQSADHVTDPLYARAIVLDDGATRVAIVVVDNLMMPRELLDGAKELAAKATKIPADRMLISATHTHSAPAVIGCLGSSANAEYGEFLATQVARAIQMAAERLQPARIGWTVVKAPKHTFNRRWIRRPDRRLADPFGQLTVQANMHPGYQNADAIGPSGPVDDDLSILAVQTPEGVPLAMLANYSQHYFGSTPLSADYFGRFVQQFTALIGAEKSNPSFVAALSQGTSGDLMWMDYASPPSGKNLDTYALELAQIAAQAYGDIHFDARAALAMRETKLTLERRLPDEARLAWARTIDSARGERLPRGLPEVYAREQLLLAAEPKRELKLQALGIGDLAITALPNEVFALTGLRLKAQSPAATTFNIALANGAEGYIPPPEQHALGGYTTWPARTAGLEVGAEPKIVEVVLKLLEEVAGKPRHAPVDPGGAYARAVLASKPIVYWRMEDMSGPLSQDSSGASHAGTYEDGVALYLPGPLGKGFATAGAASRAAHFAGGRLRTELHNIDDTYTVELWCWNGLPNNARAITGYLFSSGADGAPAAPGDHLGIGGTATAIGCLFFFNGNDGNRLLTGKNPLQPKTWNHVALVRSGASAAIYLNGRAEPEVSGEAPVTRKSGDPFFVGGRSDNFANFAGKIDELAIYPRALAPDEIVGHYAASAETLPPAVAGAPTPIGAAESLAHLQVRPGFEIELAVAEPLVQDPVAIEFGPDGKLWVVEMADYPRGLDGKMKAGGRVRYLEDTDGDGRYDRSTLFLEGVNFPTGVLPWRKGILVTAAPEIFYAEDSDGDGKADKRVTLYRGFVEGNPQLRVNGLQWGLDGWIYCANGWSGGVVRSEKTGETVNIAGRDLRIMPDEGLLDAVAGVSEFGRNRDDWGNWFGCDNSNPLFHFVIEDRYTRRNPLVASPAAKRQLMTPVNPKIFARSAPQKRYHSFEQSGCFTSACAAMIYRDELLFGAGDVEHAFVCEPVHNLVHHECLSADGLSFKAERAKEETQSEFLASDDPWFRPVMARTGPDGALWVVDMYRFMIEHPDYLPPLGQAELAPYFRLGEDRGRIYRIYPQGRRPQFPAWPLKKNQAALADDMESRNGWQRDMAQQLLLWNGGLASVKNVEHVLATSPDPRARLQALCTLDTLNALGSSLVSHALDDPSAHVRREAVRLAEAGADADATMMIRLSKMVDDDDASVRLQLALSLGTWKDSRAGRALGLLMAQSKDSYLRAAAISSVTKQNVDSVLAGLLTASADPNDREALEQILVLCAAMGRDAALVDAILTVVEPDGEGNYAPWQMTAVAQALDALEKRGKTLASLEKVAAERIAGASQKTAQITARAARVVGNAGASDDLRAAAVALLLRDASQRAAHFKALEELLVPQTAPAIQAAVVARLGQQQDAVAVETMLAGWRSHSPSLRSQILVLLLSRNSWVPLLLEAIERQQVLPADIDAARRQQLAALTDAGLRDKAHRLLGLASDADRKRALEQFQDALKLSGDVSRGSVIFEKKCAACHKLGAVGHDVGPNLAALTDRAPQSLLSAIIDPSRAVEARYLNYVAVTSDGRTQTGILEAETGNSITLLAEQGKRLSILRVELEELRSTGISLMPDGLEKDLSQQDLADLLRFVGSAGRR